MRQNAWQAARPFLWGEVAESVEVKSAFAFYRSARLDYSLLIDPPARRKKFGVEIIVFRKESTRQEHVISFVADGSGAVETGSRQQCFELRLTSRVA